jgi:hypothetical protein
MMPTILTTHLLMQTFFFPNKHLNTLEKGNQEKNAEEKNENFLDVATLTCELRRRTQTGTKSRRSKSTSQK